MKNTNSNFLKGAIIMGLAALIISFVPIQQQPDWKVPKEANALKNPIKDSEQATIAGQKLFTSMCVVCHGNKGKGDGMAGMNLKPRPTNLTTAEMQEQTDGAIYWKLTEGRTPMASYKDIIKEEERWQLVNYIRKLKK
jgi:mono/diheme cytochrome c family protein